MYWQKNVYNSLLRSFNVCGVCCDVPFFLSDLCCFTPKFYHICNFTSLLNDLSFGFVDFFYCLFSTLSMFYVYYFISSNYFGFSLISFFKKILFPYASAVTESLTFISSFLRWLLKYWWYMYFNFNMSCQGAFKKFITLYISSSVYEVKHFFTSPSAIASYIFEIFCQ